MPKAAKLTPEERQKRISKAMKAWWRRRKAKEKAPAGECQGQ